MSAPGRRNSSIPYKERSNSKSHLLTEQRTNRLDLSRDIIESMIGRRKRSITYEETSNSKSRRLEKQETNWSDFPCDSVECIFGRRGRSITYEKRLNSKSSQIEKQGPNWSDLPHDIIECVIGHLHWVDRTRMKALCKAWTFPDIHVPTIDRLPWALSYFSPIYNGQSYGDYQLMIDPFSREYVAEVKVLGRESLRHARPVASVYGWVLFRVVEETQILHLLYSPFTTEIIKLPELRGPKAWMTAWKTAFSLDATSPKSVIFLLSTDNRDHIINIKTCSPWDNSWKNFEFNHGFDGRIYAFGATYVNGVFYCGFSKGQLGAFNVELEQWTKLADHPLPGDAFLYDFELFAYDAELLLLNQRDSDSLKLYKFDFSEMRWIGINNLNNHVLFIGCSSFCAPAVGETSGLANTIFSTLGLFPTVASYGGRTSPSGSESQLYRECLEAAKCAEAWIQPPASGRIWRANDLISASRM